MTRPDSSPEVHLNTVERRLGYVAFVLGPGNVSLVVGAPAIRATASSRQPSPETARVKRAPQVIHAGARVRVLRTLCWGKWPRWPLVAATLASVAVEWAQERRERTAARLRRVVSTLAA